VKVGMCQLLIEGGEPDRNLQRACEMIEQAASEKCDIALLPECLDLAWTHPSAKNECEPIPGKFSQVLSQKAKELGIFVCAGLTEKASEGVCNSAILIDSKGEILSKYRKINVLVVGQEFYEIGNILSVVDTPFGKIGINICSDNYIEGLPIGHTLARMGAQIILSPSSWTVDHTIDESMDPYEEKWLKPYSILSDLYNIAVIGTTSVGYIVGGPYEGKKMIGCSLAVNNGELIKRGKFNEFAGELIIAEIDVQERAFSGTAIGENLADKGYKFDDWRIQNM